MDAFNDFDHAPLSVQPFADMEEKDGDWLLHLPPCCVAEIRL